jgi:hypothetical protein
MRTLNNAFWFTSLLIISVSGAPSSFGASAKPADSAVSMIVPAQILSAEIRIDSEGPSWESRLIKIDEARQFIRSAAASEGFATNTEQPLISHHPQFGGNANAADMIISSAIDSKSDLVKIIQQYEGIISRLSVENKVSVSIGRIFLSVTNPESFRNDLLRQIRVYVESTSKALLDSGNYTVTGLEQPVQLRQWGERDVELFIPFNVAYGKLKSD